MGLKKLYPANELGELLLYTIYNARARWKVCELDAKTIRKMKADLNKDYSGFSLVLDSGYMIHFINRHFYEKQPDHRSITFADIERIGEVVNGYKTVKTGNRKDVDALVFTKFTDSGVFELVVKENGKEKTLSGLSFRIMRH